MTDLTLYVTNTETIYPDYDDPFSDVAVRLYGRTREGVAKIVTVTGFDSYFYVEADQTDQLQPANHEDLVEYEETDVIPLEDRFNHLTPGVKPRRLARVIASYPGAIRSLRDHWDTTWGADVDFTNRFRVDKNIRSGVTVELGEQDSPSDDRFIVNEGAVEAAEVTDVQPRVLTFDIETDDRGSGFPAPGDARILSIVAHDSYDDEYVGFIDMDGETLESKFELGEGAADSLDDLGLDGLDKLNFERTERRMLITFASWVSERNPDLVSGWNSGDANSDGFDLPHLVERMDEVGASPSRLSREGYVDCDEYQDDWTVEIQGRTTYDLMDAWASTKFTEPDSKKLDRVADDKLDDAKIEHEDQGFFEMYDEATTKFLNYNAKDTRLTVDIAAAESVFEFKKRLHDMIGVDWDEVRENQDFVSMSVRRKCHEYDLTMVTARDNPRVREAAGNDDDVNFEGAHVINAFTGLKYNIVGIDLASLYPMTQWMLNASPDTKIDRKLAWKHDIDHVVAANGVAFRTDVDSIIRELVDEYDEIKMEYKRKRNAEQAGSDAWEAMALFYGVAKTIYNSYYGYTGWDKSPIYDPEIASAVTLTGQRVIKRTEEYLSAETVAEVVYGDTDSNYAEFPEGWDQEQTLEEAAGICDTLTNEVYPELCDEFLIDREDNRWEIELEMRAKRFFQSGSKKQYAYVKTWDEGMDFDEQLKDGEGKFDVTGYACVKSNFALLTKDTMREVLKTITRGGSQEEVASIVSEAAQSIDAHDPDWEGLGMPQGLGQKIDKARAGSEDYYKWSTTRDTPQGAHPRGAYFANHLLNVEFGKDDKPKRAYLKETLMDGEEPVDVIAYEYAHDLDPVADDIQMDVSAMQNKVLLNPMEDILNAFGLEPEAALQGKAQEQAGLGAFV